MHANEDEVVPLDVLSSRQRGIVESHLRLVQHTLNRNRHLIRYRQEGREEHELFQEGCLALIEAVRNHDASRHGHFGPYAMARIHFALSRHVHENDASVRVPFITQRRRRAKALPPAADSRSGAPLPIVQRLGDANAPPARRAQDGEFPNQPRIGDLIAERIEGAMLQVIDDMKRAPRCSPGTPEVIERCAEERWRIPEPDARMSIRKLARALDCSVGRITHCEERFRQRMGKALNNDPTYCALRDEARRGERGFDERLSPDRLAKLRPIADRESHQANKELKPKIRKLKSEI
ncbi:MAG: hypothetical protein H6818_10400 [Phycisphaerales bacterium]|nr:hypothetical protein [Phycisphaerales bacterium]MCB9863888.1 hypothetical protein [Phycisphaerales bacterium]